MYFFKAFLHRLCYILDSCILNLKLGIFSNILVDCVLPFKALNVVS